MVIRRGQPTPPTPLHIARCPLHKDLEARVGEGRSRDFKEQRRFLGGGVRSLHFLRFGVAQVVETDLGCALAVGVDDEARSLVPERAGDFYAFQQLAIGPKTEISFTLLDLQVVLLIPRMNVRRERPLPGLVLENRVLQPFEDGIVALAADEKPDGIFLVSAQTQPVSPTLIPADFFGFCRKFTRLAKSGGLGGEISFVAGVFIKLDDVLVVVNPGSGLVAVFLPPAV